MQKPLAKLVSLAHADIDHLTRLEVILHTDEMHLHLILFLLRPGKRPCIVTEDHGPFNAIGELRAHIRWLFGEDAARQVFRPKPVTSHPIRKCKL